MPRETVRFGGSLYPRDAWKHRSRERGGRRWGSGGGRRPLANTREPAPASRLRGKHLGRPFSPSAPAAACKAFSRLVGGGRGVSEPFWLGYCFSGLVQTLKKVAFSCIFEPFLRVLKFRFCNTFVHDLQYFVQKHPQKWLFRGCWFIKLLIMRS